MAKVSNKNSPTRPLLPLANPEYTLLATDGYYILVRSKDGQERRLLNWSTGIACEPLLGDARQKLITHVTEQQQRLSHASLTYETEVSLDAASKLLEAWGEPKGGIAFALDGMKANEMMIRAIWACQPGRIKMIVFEGAFHGRSVIECAATGKYEGIEVLKPTLEPLFIRLPFNNLGAVEKIIATKGASVAGILLEPIPGEGGVIPATSEF